MKLNNILLILFLSVTLIGCGFSSKEHTPTIRVINVQSYPELPDIEPVSPANLVPWNHDMPRDLNVLSVKNIKACRKIETRPNELRPYITEPVEEQPDEWWDKCGEHPIIPRSNIFIGFDIENWNTILENFYKLKERVWQYEQRILEINKQRQEWREKAKKERQKGREAEEAEKAAEKIEEEKPVLKGSPKISTE